MQQAFHENHGLQCGYCTPGMVMTAIKLLESQPRPDRRRDPARPRGQPVPLHRLREHRRRRAGGRGGDGVMAIATEQSKGIGAGRPAQGGHASSSPARAATSTTSSSRACCTWRSCAAPTRTPTSPGSTRPRRKAMPGVTAVLTGDDLEFAAGVPCASNPTGDMVHPVRPPLAKGRVRHAGEPIAVVIAADRYAARDAAAAVEVSYDPLPAVDRRRRRRWPTGRRRIHEELDSNVGARPRPQDRRRRRGVRERRGRRQAHDPKPAADPRPDRDARRRRRLEHGLRRARRLQLDPGAALPADVPGDRVRRERGQGAGDRAGRRRRLRLQAERLCRGVHRSRGVAQGRRAR